MLPKAPCADCGAAFTKANIARHRRDAHGVISERWRGLHGDLPERQPEPPQARAPKPVHPAGWEPGIAWDGREGTITTRPLAEPTPDWDALLRAWGFDPDVVEVVEPVQVRTWDAVLDGQVRTMWYYRAGVRARRSGPADMAELLAAAASSPPAPPRRPTGEAAFVVAFSDWQLGKRGTVPTVERIVRSIDAHADRLRELRAAGRRIGSVYLPGLGDLGEACDGHYAMQTFEAELDAREQRRLGRRLLLYAVDTFAPLAERVVAPAVGGNHGESRRDGKAFTTFGDNADLEVYEGVAEACAANPAAYGHVTFVIPDQSLTLTLDVGGVIVGLAHGHQARRGGATPQQKVATWWSGQAFGQRPVGDATLLLTGHSHHLSLVEHGPRTHVQVPTMDAGSQWWDETVGLPSLAGMVSLVVGEAAGPRGWSDLAVL